MIECDCAVLQGIADWVLCACYPMFGGWFFMISFFTPDGSLAESTGENFPHVAIGKRCKQLTQYNQNLSQV